MDHPEIVILTNHSTPAVLLLNQISKYRRKLGSDPSLVDMTYILTTVSLYYLTASFPTSLFVYAQNAGFSSSDVRAGTNKPFGYGAFQWEGMCVSINLLHQYTHISFQCLFPLASLFVAVTQKHSCAASGT